MPRRTAHRCSDYEYKVDYQGTPRCVCGETDPAWNGRPLQKVTSVHEHYQPIPHPEALTDDHPAGKADTSREAFANTDRAKRIVEVTELLRASVNGLTADEAAEAMGVGQATTSARFNDLKRAGMVTKVERRATRTGASAWAFKIKAGM